jgi:translation initiation factor IF-2
MDKKPKIKKAILKKSIKKAKVSIKKLAPAKTKSAKSRLVLKAPAVKRQRPKVTEKLPVAQKPLVKQKQPVTQKPLVVEKPPVLERPAVIKESKFEEVIPKYKVKQRPHGISGVKQSHIVKPKEKIEPIPALPSVPIIQAQPKDIQVYFPITVKELAARIQIKASDIISHLMKKGVLVTINQVLEEGLAKTVALDFGFNILKAPTLEEKFLKEHEEEGRENLVPRSPVVTLMGHVDHGKTSLLDAFRQSNITEREAGGITQHIGAYRVKTPKGAITFLDTPGHEAFTAMRSRGATATDIVILVVAADDGIMPQTTEAIDHARAAGVPIVVALNKIDKPTADPDRVKKQLSQAGLLAEDWGGKTIVVGVSAKTKQGIDTLLEMVLLEAELLELKANVNKSANGVVIEGRLSRGRGPVATVLVKSGTLKEGDNIVIGSHYGKIRAMINDKAEKLDKALPSVPVEISGLSGVPLAGEQFYVIQDEKTAKEIFEQKAALARQERFATPPKKITLEDIYTQIKEGKIKELRLIIKADVQGSLEALKDSVERMATEEVRVDVIHSGVGVINDADIILAAASNAIVIGFNIGISPEADERIKKEGVDVRLYRIIYDITSDIKSAMEGLLEPKIEEVFEGRAVVKQVFNITKSGAIAGCMVQKGAIGRTDSCTLFRDQKEIYKGKINSLKRFKDDVKEVKEGFECGIGLANFSEIKPGDVIEAFTIKRTARKL